MFKDLEKIIEENQKRWEKIEFHAKKLREHLESGRRATMEVSANDMAILILLLVDHIKPMNPSKEQLSDLAKPLKDLLNSLK